MVHTLHQRELDAGIVELLDVWATALAGHNRLHLNDLQGGIGEDTVLEDYSLGGPDSMRNSPG